MALPAKVVKAWLATVKDDEDVAIDEGGLTLVVVGGDAYLEVGGDPTGGDDDKKTPQ